MAILKDKYKQNFVEKVERLDSFVDQNDNVKSGDYRSFAEQKTSLESSDTFKRRLLQPNGEGDFHSVQQLVYFDNKHQRYIWNEQLQQFDRLQGLDENILCIKLQASEALTEQQTDDR
jgi:hypothetical protein